MKKPSNIKKLSKTLSLLLIAVVFLSCVENSTDSPVEKVEYEITKSSSPGDHWQLYCSIPNFAGISAPTLSDMTCDENGNLYVASMSKGVIKINYDDRIPHQLVNGLINNGVRPYVEYFVGSIIFTDNKIFVGNSNLIDEAGIFNSVEREDDIYFNPILSWHNEYANIVSFSRSPNGQLFAGAYLDILRSKDNGKVWFSDLDKAEKGFGYFFGFAFDKYANIYAATNKGVYYSDSKSIQYTNIGLADEVIMCIDINSKGWIFVGTNSGKFFRSEDKGLNWKFLYQFPVQDHRACTIYINMDDAVLAGTNRGMYRSTDNGDNWQLVGMENSWVVKIVSDISGNLFACTYRTDIYYCPN